MARFKPYSYEQTKLIPLSLSEQIQEGTLYPFREPLFLI
jgi:hypothetical protein